MNDGLRPYPEYKESSLHWVGRIPKHWNEKRAKYLFREVDERSTTGEETLMSVSHKTGVTPRKSNVTMFKAASNVGHKICRSGDLAINTLWAWMAALGVARETGLVSPAYGVYRQRESANYHPEFIDFLLRTQSYADEYRCRSTGITTSRLRLYPIDFLCIPLVQPPPHEQELIVSYLRKHDVLVRKFIRNRRRLIEVLNEQKQAIINQAITRGVDSAAPLKPSGIDCLGDVPEHWIVKPLKRWAGINLRTLSATTDPDYEFSYIDIGAVGTGFLLEQPERIRFGKAPSRARRMLSRGDTIISTVRTYLKAVYFIADDPHDLIASTGFAVLSPSGSVEPEALSLAVQSKTFVEMVTAHSVGIAYPAIAETRLAALHLALPPTSEEQIRIVNQIKKLTESLDVAILRTQREMRLINEYRERLIADVVTGKLDVRHLAPQPGSFDVDELANIDAEEAFDDELDGIEEGDLAEEALNADD